MNIIVGKYMDGDIYDIHQKVSIRKQETNANRENIVSRDVSNEH